MYIQCTFSVRLVCCTVDELQTNQLIWHLPHQLSLNGKDWSHSSTERSGNDFFFFLHTVLAQRDYFIHVLIAIISLKLGTSTSSMWADERVSISGDDYCWGVTNISITLCFSVFHRSGRCTFSVHWVYSWSVVKLVSCKQISWSDNCLIS